MAHQDPLTVYLRRLRWSLAALPEAERREIVEETRAHLAERMDAGLSASEAIAALGPADAYARAFIDEMELSAAMAGQATGAVALAVLNRAHRSLIAAAALVIALALLLAALGVLATAAAKPFAPDSIGLWVGPGDFFFGHSDPRPDRREILGPLIYLVAPLTAAAAWWAGRWTLLWALRRLARR